MKKTLILLAVLCVFLSTSSFCASNSVMERAITLYKWKYYDDAVIELNKLISQAKEPWSSRALFLKAHCLYKKGDVSYAEDIFRILSLKPDFALCDYSKYYIGEIYLNKKDYEMAYNQYVEISAGSTLRPEADIKMAECLYQLMNIKEALEINKALIAENSSLAQLDRARFNLGKCYEKSGMPKEAIKAYHEVNLYHPLSPLVKEAVSRIGYLSRKYKIYPGAASAEDIYNKAMVYYNFGDFASAGITFQKIVTNYKKSNLWEDALFKLAFCDYKRKKMSSAISRFKLCVKQGGDFADAAQFYLAFAYGKTGYFYQALDCLNKVMINHPNSQYADDAAYYLGYYYEMNNFKDTALKYYDHFAQQFPKSEFLDDAYWRIGRLNYFKKDYAKACEAFSKAVWSCTSGDLLDACAYWKALSQEKMGNKWDAVASYQFVVGRYDHTYYGYRAREKLSALGVPNIEMKEAFADPDAANMINEGPFASTPLPDDQAFMEESLPFEPGIEDRTVTSEGRSIKAFDTREHFKKYSELMAIGFYDEAAKEAAALIVSSPADKKMSAKLALASANLGAGQIKGSIVYAEGLCNSAIISGTSGQLPRAVWHLAYPKGYYKYVSEYANKFGIEESLVLAVIREESRFNPKTLSWAQARGLMQIIPPTGMSIARLIGIKSYYTKKLHDPDTNIKMGCYYLSQLLKRFNNDKVMALAAYNGGPSRVQRWRNKWWNKGGPNIDIDEFVESIPLSETKRYVQKVMKSYYEYKRHYSEKFLRISVKG
ncbi:MAG: transglycosylase SLT domain-containing protein [bacterium]